MEKKESVLKGIAQYSISTWINLVVGFLSIILTTRVLLPDEYGMVSIFLSATNFLMYIVTFGMDGAYIRFYNSPPGRDTKKQLLYKIMILSTIICVIFGSVCTLFFYNETSEYIFGVKSRLLIGMVFVYVFCQAILRFLNINFRMGFKVKQYTIQNILISCLARVLIIISAVLTDGIMYIVSIVSIGTLIVLIFYMFLQRKEFVPYNENGVIELSIKLKEYGSFFRFAVFSAPTYFVTYFNSFMSQQIIRSSLSSHELGIFSSCGMFSSIFSAVKGGFATYWSAYVYKNHDTERKKITEMHDYIVLFSIVIYSMLIMMRDVVFIVIGKEYHSSKHFFSLLLLMPVLSLILETTDKGIALAKKNEIILITHIVAAVTNIVGCYLLIPIVGVIGAAYADAGAALVLYVANTFWGQKYYRTIKNWSKSVLGIIIILSLMMMPVLIFDIKIIVCVILSLNILTFIIYKKEYKFLFQSVCQYIDKIRNKKKI